MEYQNLVLYPNLYPSLDSYGRTLDGNFALLGKYDTDNAKSFPNPSLDDIQVVDNTTFKFILSVKESEESDEVQYFTSQPFYDDLIASISENNPYFINNALNPNLFIKVVLDTQIRIFNELKLIDLGTGVKQNQNLFILADNSIDYITLVQYVDWVVGKVNPLDDENNGVLPAEKIADYEIGEYNKDTGEFTPNSEKTVALANRLEKLYDELDEVDAAIAALEGDIPAEPKKRKTSALEVISLGLGAVSVLQGVSAASKALKAANAIKSTQKTIEIVKLSSSIKPIPPIATPAVKVPDFAKLFPGYNVPSSIAASNKITSAANKVKGFAANAKKIAGAAKNAVTTAVSTTTKLAGKASGLVSRGLRTQVGSAVAAAAVNATASGVATGAGGNVAAKNAIVKSVAKTAAVEVGKVVAKSIAKKVLTGTAAKLLGAATGPIGAGIMAAVGIVKFFVGKAKQKKEFNKQKAEYDKVMAEFNRLTKRKDEIEFEINSILKSGKLTLDGKPAGDERYSSTQKYFQNIGRNILLRQQQQQENIQTSFG